MTIQVIIGILLPFLGTTLGAMLVFFMKKEITPAISKGVSGFAGGVMTAASVFSLLIPAMEFNASLGRYSFLPASVGFVIGVVTLLLLDSIIPRLRKSSGEEGVKSQLGKNAMITLAVGIHNFPEGMAIGVVYAGLLACDGMVSASGALALSLGIAIQNLPEGAIISMPLKSEGRSKLSAFLIGVSTAVIELLGALIMIWASRLFSPLLPYVLGFAAGAMIFVVVEELVPDNTCSEGKNIGSVMFGVGFLLMMILDVATS